MKVLATYSIKGGVGKTAAATNLAWLAARDGAPTLIWDLDPQGAVTFNYRIRPRVKGGAKGVVGKKRPLEDAIKGTDYHALDLLPADFRYRNLDVLLDQVKKSTQRLARLLRQFEDDYDWVILDCAPSISLTSEAILFAADAVLVPVVPTTLSTRTLDQLTAFVEDKAGLDVQILPFLSMVDRRKKLHCELQHELLEHDPRLLHTPIPNASAVERMGLLREPLVATSPRHAAARAYEALWEEIRERLHRSGRSNG
jgi:chromosome partitioning protein